MDQNQDKPSWFWRRVLVFTLCLLLLEMGGIALIYKLQGKLSDVALGQVMDMLKVVLPAIAVAYIGGAVWDDANFIKSLRDSTLKQVKKVGDAVAEKVKS